MADSSRQGKHPALSVATNLARSKPQNDFEFNLQSTKVKVLKAIDDRCPAVFKKFYLSPLYDRMVNALMMYFVAKFMQDWILRTNEKMQKQHLEGINMARITKRVQELEEELTSQRMEISPLYSEVILKYSIYEKPLQDKMFFESMYESLILILDDAFQKLEKRAEIQKDIGLLFRSKHFNSNSRKFQPPRSIDTLSIKELYTLKNETMNRALNSKMLSALREKPPTLAIQVASVTNSPLISQYLRSPIVARAIVKDPVERQKLFDKINSPDASMRRSKSPTPGVGTDSQSVAWAQSLALSGSGGGSGDLESSSPSLDHQNSGFLFGDETGGGRGSGTGGGSGAGGGGNRLRGMTVPDSGGLPLDENFHFLVLLQRYVQYGPSLGMQGMQGMQKSSSFAPGAGAVGMHSISPIE